MELEREDGNSIPIESRSPTFIGRELGLGLGPSSSDRSISRHQVCFHLPDITYDKIDANDQADELLLSFEVVGKNPILVCSKNGEAKRIYRKAEKGVLRAGDRISLSIRNPNFLFVKRSERKKDDLESSVLDALARRERRTNRRRKEAEERGKLEEFGGENEEVVWEGLGLEIGSLDVSEIDPVKEFGFLVRGHEFDQYPRRKIRHWKDWNWFLEDPRGASKEDDEEDEPFGTSLKGKRHKRKNGDDDDDENWEGENEDETILDAKPGSGKRPRYSTRSKNPKKPLSNIRDSKKAVNKGSNGQQKELDNEDDETLGGFIVGDDDIEEEDEEMLEEETEDEEEDGDDEESDVD